jgi:hypothetical protein
VPVAVVDLLEPVDVDDEQGGLLSVAPRASDLVVDVPLEPAPFARARERAITIASGADSRSALSAPQPKP